MSLEPHLATWILVLDWAIRLVALAWIPVRSPRSWQKSTRRPWNDSTVMFP